MSMSTTVSLYNTGGNLLHFKEMVKGVKPTSSTSAAATAPSDGAVDVTPLASVLEDFYLKYRLLAFSIRLPSTTSWENPHFSRSVLTELLWHCGFTYFQDMRRHTELLLNILLVEDSWQNHRIHNALISVTDERAGLLETIQKVKQHYEKRAYQIIKCLVQLFRESRVAATMLNTNQNIARHWTLAVEWLQDELDRKRGVTGQYNYSSWSPPAPTNDNLAYMLLRSQSAENTLQMAAELCPEEEQDEQADSDVEQLEEYPSTEQITAVISTQNEDSQPDQTPFDGSIDSEPLSLVKNEASTKKNFSISERERREQERPCGRSRVTSSQNVVSTNPIQTNFTNI